MMPATEEINAKRQLTHKHAKNMQRSLCTNADVKIMVKDEGMKSEESDVDNIGCRNPRRQGSKYCQECSDKHHKIGE